MQVLSFYLLGKKTKKPQKQDKLRLHDSFLMSNTTTFKNIFSFFPFA